MYVDNETKVRRAQEGAELLAKLMAATGESSRDLSLRIGYHANLVTKLLGGSANYSQRVIERLRAEVERLERLEKA
jgi:hypothetical protein